MAQEKEVKSTYQKRREAKETKKDPVEKGIEVKVATKPEAKKYSARGYCNTIGAAQGVHFVAKLKFKAEGKKTIKEWEEIFKKEQIV